MGIIPTGSWFEQFQQPVAPQPSAPVSGDLVSSGNTDRLRDARPEDMSFTTATGGGNSGPIPWAQIYAGLPPTADSLPIIVERLKAMGYDAAIAPRGQSGTRRNPDGSLQMSDDKLIVNGQGYDAIRDVGGAGASWLSNPLTFTVGGDRGASGGGTLGSMAQGNSPYATGSALAPWTKTWNMPTAQQAQNMPGFQYALGRAQQAIERSAASKGTLLTGGLLRDLSENQIGIGMQQYGQLYDLAKDDYMTDRDNFFQNQDRPWGKLRDLAGAGRPA